MAKLIYEETARDPKNSLSARMQSGTEALSPSYEEVLALRRALADAERRAQQAEHKCSETARTAKHAGFHQLFHNLPGAGVVCRMHFDDQGVPLDYTHLNANPAFERLIGIPNPVGRAASDLTPGMLQSNPELFATYCRVAKTGHPERLETFIASLGSWFEVSVFSLEADHFVAIFDNISDRKQAEEALRASERIYRAIGESIDYGIWICTPDGRNTYASQSFLDLVGITQEQCSNFGWGDTLDPQDAERTLETWKECARNEGKWDIEHRYRRKVDGQYHAILARGAPVRNERGEIECWAGINLDISRQKATEELLLRQQRRLELIAHTASQLLMTDDPLTVVNDLCRKVMDHLDAHVFFNYVADSESNLLHLNAWAGIPDEEAKRIEWLEYGVAVCGCAAQSNRRIVVGNVQDSTELQTALIRSYGVDAYCCHPLFASGRVIGTLSFGTRTRASFSNEEVELMHAVATQVSTAMERLLVLQELSRANAQLRNADRQKSQFLAVLSHELRNPLTPIRNSLCLLDRSPPSSVQAQRARQTIERQVSQMARLVDDLLDITRLTRGMLRMERSRIDLAEVVRRTTEDHRSHFEASQLSFETAYRHPGPLWIDGDAARLAQAVGNLLVNAAKFTAASGAVSLCLEVDDLHWAVIRVRDSGVGISREMLDQLFLPFVQADGSLDRSKGGLGLGLSLVRGICELHGGKVDAYSDGLGTGAEFVIRLPREPNTTNQIDPTPPSQRAPARRVLIVEDNVDAADTLRELLELGGHHVDVAYTGPEGVEKARKCAPDVVLCDIGLPGFDGYAVANALRHDPALSSTRIVALSGYAQPEDLQRAREAGFDDHVAKPPTMDQIEAVLSPRA